MIEFIKFGNAVSVAGTNLSSAHSKDYNIERIEDFVFSIAPKRKPEQETLVAITNVSEWRKDKNVAKAKSKTAG